MQHIPVQYDSASNTTAVVTDCSILTGVTSPLPPLSLYHRRRKRRQSTVKTLFSSFCMNAQIDITISCNRYLVPIINISSILFFVSQGSCLEPKGSLSQRVCVLYLVSLCLVSCVLYQVSCILHLVSTVAVPRYKVYLVSYTMYLASCIFCSCQGSRTRYHVSCVLCLVFCTFYKFLQDVSSLAVSCKSVSRYVMTKVNYRQFRLNIRPNCLCLPAVGERAGCSGPSSDATCVRLPSCEVCSIANSKKSSHPPFDRPRAQTRLERQH